MKFNASLRLIFGVALLIMYIYTSMVMVSNYNFGEGGERSYVTSGRGVSKLYHIWNDVCSNGTFLLVVVHSAVQNAKLRQSIRKTWGSLGTVNGKIIKTVFVLGSNNLEMVQSKIAQENLAHGDIIQGKFIDSYGNLTRKHHLALTFAVDKCSTVRHILKADDDVFVNMAAVVNYLITTEQNNSSDIKCNVLKHEKPHRDPSHKLFVSEKDYPEPEFPPFCMGMAILYSRKAATMLVKASEHAQVVDKIDDVYFGGILPQTLGIRLEEIRGRYSETGGNTLEWIRSSDRRPTWFFFALVWRRPRGGMERVWKRVIDDT